MDPEYNYHSYQGAQYGSDGESSPRYTQHDGGPEPSQYHVAEYAGNAPPDHPRDSNDQPPPLYSELQALTTRRAILNQLNDKFPPMLRHVEETNRATFAILGSCASGSEYESVQTVRYSIANALDEVEQHLRQLSREVNSPDAFWRSVCDTALLLNSLSQGLDYLITHYRHESAVTWSGTQAQKELREIDALLRG